MLAIVLRIKKKRITRQTHLSDITSVVMNRIPTNYTSTDQVMIVHPDGSISYEPNTRHQQPTIIRRSYRTPPKPKYRYMIEQVH